MIYVREERADYTVREKKSIKINLMIEKKLSIIFAGAISNAFENSFFATVHNLPVQKSRSSHYIGKAQCFLGIKN
jgi:hypothetical protein